MSQNVANILASLTHYLLSGKTGRTFSGKRVKSSLTGFSISMVGGGWCPSGPMQSGLKGLAALGGSVPKAWFTWEWHACKGSGGGTR